MILALKDKRGVAFEGIDLANGSILETPKLQEVENITPIGGTSIPMEEPQTPYAGESRVLKLKKRGVLTFTPRKKYESI